MFVHIYIYIYNSSDISNTILATSVAYDFRLKTVKHWSVLKQIEAGHSTECITHASHSITFNVFALCDPVTFDLTRDVLSLWQVW